MLPRRTAETIRVTPSDAEGELYRAISSRVREEGREATTAKRLALRSVQQLAGSSPWACADTLARLGWEDLGLRAACLSSSAKVAALRPFKGRSTMRFCSTTWLSVAVEVFTWLAKYVPPGGR